MTAIEKMFKSEPIAKYAYVYMAPALATNVPQGFLIRFLQIGSSGQAMAELMHFQLLQPCINCNFILLYCKDPVLH